MLKIYFKFYPVLETCTVEVAPEADVAALKAKIYEETNLVEQDTLRLVYKGAPITSDKLKLQDIHVQENDTFHVIVDNCKAGTAHVKKQKNPGILAELKDVVLLTIFSFLDHESLCQLSLVNRKWKTFSHSNQLLWKYNYEAILRRHSAENPVAEKEKIISSPRGRSESKLQPFKQMFVKRLLSERRWDNARVLSLLANVDPASLKFKAPKEIRLPKKPKPLSEEEDKFLKENDIKALKKLVRRDKGAKEKVKKAEKIQKKLDTYKESLVTWNSIPENFKLVEYDDLIKRTMGFPDGASAEGFEAYYTNGKFFFLKNGHLVFEGFTEIQQPDVFRISKIIVEEQLDESIYKAKQNEDTLIKDFFKQYAQCGAKNVAAKKLVSVKTGSHVSSKADAIANVNLTWATGEAKVAEIAAKPEEQTATLVLPQQKAQQLRYTVAVPLYNQAESSSVNAQNIQNGYLAAMREADANDAIATIALPLIESEVIAVEKVGEAENVVKGSVEAQEGLLLANAVTEFAKTRKETEEQATSGAEHHEAPESSKTVKKQFTTMTAFVKSEEEKTKVIAVVRKALNL